MAYDYGFDQVKKIILSSNVKKTSLEIGIPIATSYGIRTRFAQYIRDPRAVLYKKAIPYFDQLKKEGITEVTPTPNSFYGRTGGLNSSKKRKEFLSMKEEQVSSTEENPSNQESSSIQQTISNKRDPILELEISFNIFKEKINELIPLIVDEQIKEAVLQASRKGAKKVRILR
jgi:hypothetical protein